MSAFADAAAEVAETLAEEVGESVTYARGATSVTLTAVVGQSSETTVDDKGNMLVVRLRDFLVRRSVLTLGEPKTGDRITRADGSIWEVSPTSNDRGFRDSDNHGVSWRIHTKRVS